MWTRQPGQVESAESSNHGVHSEPDQAESKLQKKLDPWPAGEVKEKWSGIGKESKIDQQKYSESSASMTRKQDRVQMGMDLVPVPR